MEYGTIKCDFGILEDKLNEYVALGWSPYIIKIVPTSPVLAYCFVVIVRPLGYEELLTQLKADFNE